MLRRLSYLVLPMFALILGASVVASPPSTSSAPSAPAVSAQPCSAGSFFHDDVRDNATSPTLTASFKSFMATHPDQRAVSWPKVNLNDSWSGLSHIGQASDPVWKIVGGNTSNSRLKILSDQGVHLADSVLNENPVGSQDRLLVVYDPVFGYVAQMADTVPNFATRTITVGNAGIMWYSSNCLDYRNPKSDDARNFTSRGRITPSMQVPAAWLQQAIDRGTGVGYPLHLFFAETRTTDGFTHPMVGGESRKAGWGAEGWRIRIDPAVNLATRGLTPGCLALARTLQESGGYLGDNSGSGTQLKVGHPSAYPASMGLSTDCMKDKVSWSEFQVVTPGQQ